MTNEHLLVKEIDKDEMLHYFNYFPESGIFTHKNPRAKKMVGSVAGTLTNNGYIRLSIKGKQFSASRVAWVVSVGQIPKDMDIDHIDRNRSNNRLSNLRLATASENRNNATPKFGETQDRYFTLHKSGRWQVVVKKKYLGLCATQEEARAKVKHYLEL